MPNKQNNDDSENVESYPNSLKTTSRLNQAKQPSTQRQDATQSQQLNIQSSLKLSTKKPSQKSSQLKSKDSLLQLPSSSLTLLSPLSILPITINDLQEKTLNLYLKQFMQISTFQHIQKGKQLIELIKQSPGSKQTTSAINKCFQLFKSNIPDAILCSLQFFRELIEIGNWKVFHALEELMLMPLVEVIEYRAYLQHMDRGNTYFINQVYRYCQDDKTNHLIKIGSTFFRMVHEVLYIWGTFYFPESNFNKMLNKLMKSSNIKFPQYPQEFKFYSESRVEFFRAVFKKNSLAFKTEQEQFKRKNDKGGESKDKGYQTKSVVLQKQSTTINQLGGQVQISKKENSEDLSPKNDSPVKLIKKGEASKQKTQNIQGNKMQQSSPQLQSVRLQKQPAKQKQKQNFNEKSSEKNIEQYKKMKPSKAKSKKSNFTLDGGSGRNIESEKRISKVQSLNDTQNALILIEEIEQIEVFKPKQGPDSKDSKQNRTKSPISKEMLKIDLKKITNQRSQSEIQSDEQTFRPLQHQIATKTNSNQKPISNQDEVSSEYPETFQQISTDRQRFNESINEQGDETGKSCHSNKRVNEKSRRNEDGFVSENAMREFFKKEFENLKGSIIDGISKSVISAIKEDKVSKQFGHEQYGSVNSKPDQIKMTQSDSHANKRYQTHQNHQHNMVSGRFGTKTAQENIDPSTQAFQFIKRKFKSGKKLRTSSKLKRKSLLEDLQQDEIRRSQDVSSMKQNVSENHKAIIIPVKTAAKAVVQHGVNTDEFRYQKMYQQINSLKEKLNIVTSNPFSSKRQSNSFFKTPHAFNTINKNQHQDRIGESEQSQSLRSTLNTTRKRSKSKLSERRSSLQATLIEKAALRPENCKDLFGSVYGDSNTLLFNAAVSSVKKKRKSVMFC